MKSIYFIPVVCIIFCLSSCSSADEPITPSNNDNIYSVTMQEVNTGIAGKIWVWNGNQKILDGKGQIWQKGEFAVFGGSIVYPFKVEGNTFSIYMSAFDGEGSMELRNCLYDESNGILSVSQFGTDNEMEPVLRFESLENGILTASCQFGKPYEYNKQTGEFIHDANSCIQVEFREATTSEQAQFSQYTIYNFCN